MPKVAVYRFRVYDIGANELRDSQRWATPEAIRVFGAVAIEDS